MDACNIELKAVISELEVFMGEESDMLIVYQKIDCRIIWEVKIENILRKKEIYSAGGHATETPNQ